MVDNVRLRGVEEGGMGPRIESITISTLSPLKRVGSGNSFSDEFLKKSAVLLGELRFVDNELRHEAKGWTESGVSDSLTSMWFGLFPERKNARAYEEMRDFLRSALYTNIGNIANAQSMLNFGKHTALFQVSPKKRASLKELATMFEEHGREYRNAIQELIDKHKEVASVLIREFIEFMKADVSHFKDFCAFLTGVEFAPIRKENTYFIEMLARHNGTQSARGADFFGELKKQLLKKEEESPSQHIFETFLGSVVKSSGNGSGDKAYSDVAEWLKLFSAFSSEIDATSVLKKIRESGSFPPSFRKSYSNFLGSELNESMQKMKIALSSYREGEVRRVLSFSLEVRSSKRNKVKVPGSSVPVARAVIVTKPVYTLVLRDGRFLSGDWINGYVEQAARRISTHGEGMLHDVRATLQSLVEDPYGFGTGKLTSLTESSPFGPRRIPLRRYRPDQRPGLVLEHPEGRRLRAVYLIDSHYDPRKIVLVGLMHHDEFDSKFSPVKNK